jgi:hypothetical protein
MDPMMGTSPASSVRAPKVILLGGAPMSGKSTVARAIASRLGFTVISTDDLGIAARAIAGSSEHPDLHAFARDNHQEYYISHSEPDLLNHAQQAHRALWPALRSVIQAHLAWAPPAVIEGWAILPDLISESHFDGVASAWIEAPGWAIESRVRGNASFWSGASDPELMIEKFTGRSAGFASWLRKETAHRRLLQIALTGLESPSRAAEICLERLGLRPGASA